MDGFIESPVTAGPVENVEPQETEQVETTQNESSEVVDTQVAAKPVQDAETNRMYKEMRLKAEAEAKAEAQRVIDAEYDRLYGEQYGIHSKADYDKAVADYQEQQRLQAEAERTGASPELLKEIEELKAFKNETLAEKQRREQEEQVKSVEKEANELVTKAKEEGFEITVQQLAECVKKSGVVNLADAYKILKADVDIKSIKENAIKEYIEARKSGKIPVEGSGTTPIVASEPPKDFNSAKEGALAMLRASKLFKNN